MSSRSSVGDADAEHRFARETAGAGNREPQTRAGSERARKKSLSNNAFNFIVDCIMLVCGMCVLAATLVLAFVFPPASRAAGYSIWGHDYEGWSRFLVANVSIFLVLILLHILLHWSWVCMFVTSRLSKRLGRKITLNDSAKTIWGVMMLIIVLTIVAMFVAAAEFALVEPKKATSRSSTARVSVAAGLSAGPRGSGKRALNREMQSPPSEAGAAASLRVGRRAPQSFVPISSVYAESTSMFSSCS